uniref:AHH domain-containing protein n=1 Tax=uncultured Xanthomonas sp. TaxID=152831 RepID=UPI0031BB51AF
MANYRTLFQDHHNIEQQTLKNSELLAKLQEVGKFHIHAPENRLFLPASPQLADALGVTPHSGGPLAEYQKGMLERLNRIQSTRDGQAALMGDPDAMDRVAKRVEQLRDTVKVGLINGDLNTNTPVGELPTQTSQRVRQFFKDIPAYYQTHSQQVEALKGFTGVDHGWGAVAHSESRIVTTLNQIQVSNAAIVRGGDIQLQRSGFSLAIANAHHDGRVVLSEQGILKVEQVLGPEAAQNIRVPRGQRGEVAMELLMGEASARGLTRAGGLLATGADAVMTARTAATLMEQGNLTAAQSEVNHAVARNVGGWAGGASTAAALGSSGGFVPAALVVGDAVLMSKAFDKAVDLKENRDIFHQTDKAGVEWQFNGRDWERQGTFDRVADGREAPAQVSVGASYVKSQELGAMAN